MLEFTFAPSGANTGTSGELQIRSGACTNAEANGEEEDDHEKPDGI